jgi:hypothetical protein
MVEGCGRAVGESFMKAAPAKKLVVRGLILWLILLVVWLLYAKPFSHETLLDAARLGHMSRARYLLKKGSDINRKGIYGETALIQAVWGKHIDVIELLLDRGADVNAQDGEGNTALIWAAGYGDRDAVSLLVDRGANMNLQNNEGDTAIMCAMRAGHRDVVKLLLASGSDINIENVDGETVLVKAGQRGFVVMVDMLRSHGAVKTEVFLNKSPYPTQPLSPAQLWALASTALLVQYNGDSHELLGSIPLTEKDRAQNILTKWWGIGDRQKALETLEWLIAEGHRMGFETMRRQISAMDRRELSEYMRQYGRTEDQRAQLRLVWKRRQHGSSGSILAWDLCRYIFVAGQCYVAGYLTEQECWSKTMPVARQIQSSFASWADMGENYLLGREYWSGNRDARFEFIFKLLTNPNDPNSPWNKNPWQLDLSNPSAQQR